MCGRYSLEFDQNFFKRYKTTNKVNLKPHYNVAPSQKMPVILSHSPNEIHMMVWGLVPFWEQKKEKPKGLINLRDDTILNKSWAHKYIQFQRCLIPSTGFFEWKKTEDGKQPYYFHLKDKKYFSFAGLYSSYKPPNTEKEYQTYAIITTSPNKLMEPVHNRMPAILNEEDEEKWLNPDLVETEQIAALIKPYDDKKMGCYMVSKVVNNPTQDSKTILERTTNV